MYGIYSFCGPLSGMFLEYDTNSTQIMLVQGLDIPRIKWFEKWLEIRNPKHGLQ
jgi:hypothetical protein